MKFKISCRGRDLRFFFLFLVPLLALFSPAVLSAESNYDWLDFPVSGDWEGVPFSLLDATTTATISVDVLTTECFNNRTGDDPTDDHSIIGLNASNPDGFGYSVAINRNAVLNGFGQQLQSVASCELSLTSVAQTDCTYDPATGQSTFEVTITVSWDYSDLNTINELINITVGGQTATIDPASMATGMDMVVIPNVAGPVVAAIVTAEFATTTTCSATSVVDLAACTPECITGVGGTVWNDQDNDGNGPMGADTDEMGQENIKVEVYDCDGVRVCETWTNADGEWTCPALTDTGEEYRVEFSNPLYSYLQPSRTGPDNGSDVQFVSGGDCEVDYGTVNVNDYCDDNPLVIVPRYVRGDNAGVEDVIVSWRYDDTGEPASLSTVSGSNQVATTWGLAYDRYNRTVYASAALKRHNGLSDEGLDAIFLVDPNSASLNGVAWLELGILGVDVGQGDIGDNTARGLVGDGPGYDVDAYSLVGTIGIGDIDLNSAATTMYATNIKEGTLLEIDVASQTLLNTYPVPNPGCEGGNFRIWAVEVHDDEVYVGGVCDGITSGSTNDLSATIYRLVGSDFVEVLSFPLDYEREPVVRQSAPCNAITQWQAWSNTETASCRDNSAGEGFVINPQPMLTDIQIINNGDMVVGFSDRNGWQWGYQNYRPDPAETDTKLFNTISGGDILYACAASSTSWEIESTPDGCVNTTGGAISTSTTSEYFGGDEVDLNVNPDGLPEHAEIVVGALGYLACSNEILVSVFDPITGMRNPDGSTRANTGGVITLDLMTGERSREGVQLYGGTAPTSGKSVGIGDLAIDCGTAPAQIGNYAWVDENEDGIQQACEPSLPGLTVKLYRKDGATPVQIASTFTDANGNYYFSSASAIDPNLTWEGTDADTSLQTGEQYFIAFCGDNGFNGANNTIEIGSDVYCLTGADRGEGSNPDLNDSDATVQNILGEMIPAYCTQPGEADTVNHSFDIGFKPVCPFVDLVVSTPTLCSTDSLTLTGLADSILNPVGYGYSWSTDGDGMFLDATGDPTTDYNEAVTYAPGEGDITSGGATLSLSSDSATAPADCDVASDELAFSILRANCGAFFWDGGGQ